MLLYNVSVLVYPFAKYLVLSLSAVDKNGSRSTLRGTHSYVEKRADGLAPSPAIWWQRDPAVRQPEYSKACADGHVQPVQPIWSLWT